MAKAKTEPGKKRTTIYLPEELIWKMREIRAKLRIASDTQAIEIALAEWVKEAGSSLAASPKPHIIDSHKKGAKAGR